MFSRRRFLQGLGVGVIALNGCQRFLHGDGEAKAQVVIVGGGFAGATAAKTIRQLDADISVTIIEPKASYISCPGSNWLYSGITEMANLTWDYQALSAAYGVKVLTDYVASVDADKRCVILSDGETIRYDKLIMSPGIDFVWDALPGYNEATAQILPHAWQAGPQTLLLQKQLQAMDDGGLLLIYVPAEPYRCPPGPYERASMMACWLKQHKPRAKIIILDAKRSFSKQKLFEAGWAKHFGYGGGNSLIEWHSIADNPLISVDSNTGIVETDFGDQFKAQVLNIIPPQQAGNIARQAGLTDVSGWCPVDAKTCCSKFQENIHVIGDAANYAPIPKSAFAANSEAKVCARAVVSLINQQPAPEPQWLNTCYSLITPEHGISVAGVYQLAGENIEAVKGAGGTSKLTDPAAPALEAAYAKSVYRTLVQDSFS